MKNEIKKDIDGYVIYSKNSVIGGFPTVKEAENYIKKLEKIERVKHAAIKKGFGPNALQIIYQAAFSPVNPWRFFGNRFRRNWSYGYFQRLHRAGFLRQIEAPEGCRGHRWYVLGELQK